MKLKISCIVLLGFFIAFKLYHREDTAITKLDATATRSVITADKATVSHSATLLQKHSLREQQH